MDRKLIVLEPATNIRARGRAALAGNWQKAALAMLVYLTFTGLIPSLIDSILGWSYLGPGNIEVTGSPSWLYLLLITGPFSLGLVVYFISLFRHQDTNINNLFSGFERFGKAIVLGLLLAIFIFLWMLLLIVPGIIAIFRYSQAFYIMNDHPEYSAMDCIRESKRVMTGNKAKLFGLMLSFIGWGFLAILPGAIYSGAALDLYEIPGVFDSIVIFVLQAGLFWVGAYFYTSLAAFYELLKGNITGQVFAPEEF